MQVSNVALCMGDNRAAYDTSANPLVYTADIPTEKEWKTSLKVIYTQ